MHNLTDQFSAERFTLGLPIIGAPDQHPSHLDPWALDIEPDDLLGLHWQETKPATAISPRPGDTQALHLLCAAGSLDKHTLHAAAYAPHGLTRRAVEMRLPRLHEAGLLRAATVLNAHRHPRHVIYRATPAGARWAHKHQHHPQQHRPPRRKPEGSDHWRQHAQLVLSACATRLATTASALAWDADPVRRLTLKPSGSLTGDSCPFTGRALHDYTFDHYAQLRPDAYITTGPTPEQTPLLIFDITTKADDIEGFFLFAAHLDHFLADWHATDTTLSNYANPPVALLIAWDDDQLQAAAYDLDKTLSVRIGTAASPTPNCTYPARLRTLLTTQDELLKGAMRAFQLHPLPPGIRPVGHQALRTHRLLPAPAHQTATAGPDVSTPPPASPHRHHPNPISHPTSTRPQPAPTPRSEPEPIQQPMLPGF